MSKRGEIHSGLSGMYFSTFYGKKSTFLPYPVKKNHSTLFYTLKVMLLLSYLASLDNKPHT